MLFEHLDLLLDPTPHDGPLNMALDEILARTTERPALRIYRWDGPWISFGYFGRHEQVAARWPSRPLVRRWTGGGEVPHDADFTYTLAIPASHPFARESASISYRRVHAVIAALLPGAALAETEQGNAAACFAHPVVSDVLVKDRKIAGAAQRRGTFGLLHQGSIQAPLSFESFAHSLARALAPQVSECTIGDAFVAAAKNVRASRYGTTDWQERR